MATNLELAQLIGTMETEGKTSSEIVIDAYEKLFNRTPDTDGMTYWAGRLDSGLSVEDFNEALLDGVRFYDGEFSDLAIADLALTSSKRTVADALIAAEVTGDDAVAILATVTDTTSRDAALVTAADMAPDDVVDGGDVVSDDDQTVSLDTKANNVVTAGGDDTIYAFVQQNEAGTGGIANALSTGDMIDGKGGVDTLDATLINDETVNNTADFAVMPVITDVENIRIQALENGIANDLVILDTDRTTGEDLYASDKSRADLVITNVNIAADQITKDITIEMKSTQQNSDLAVYFNEADLKTAPDATTASAEFYIQVADGNAQDTTKPLDNIKFDLSFTQGTTTYTFTELSAIGGTYAGLVSTVEAALAEQGLVGYEVATGTDFTAFTTDSGTDFGLDYTGKFVTVTDTNGVQFDDVEFTPSQKSGTALAIILAQSEVDAEVVTVTSSVETTIILDDVGRSSNGGELIVGSTSASDSSTGIDIFNITVENSSVVHDISTTNGTMDKINLTNGTVKGDFVLTNAAYTNNVETYGNVDNDSFMDGLANITATNFDGDITLGRDNDIMNLGTLSANVAGDVTYNATMNDAGTHTVVTGAGNDTLAIDLASTNVTVSTGNGTNTVTVDETAGTTTATITGGASVDTINGNDVAVTVVAGSGDDVIYAENTGEKAILKFTTSTLADPVTATDALAGEATIGEFEFLHNSQVQVTLTATGAAANTGTAADEFDLGFESALVAIQGSSAAGYLTTEADINTAILKAINEDATLSKIATASVDASGDVVVSYMVDGQQVAASLAVEFYAPATTLSTTITNAAIAAWEETYKESDEFPTDTADYATAQAAALAAANAIVSTLVTADEKFTVTFDANGTATETLIFDTVTTTIADTNGSGVVEATEVAAQVATAHAASATYTVVDNGNGSVSFTAIGVNTATYMADVTDVITTGTYGTAKGLVNNSLSYVVDTQGTTGTGLDATNSGANSVNGGAGDDVIVLSSDVLATDSVVLTDYNQGTDTIVHFTTGANTLDLSAYLTNTITDNVGSISEDSQVQFTSIIAGDAGVNLTANSVTVIGFANAGFTSLLDTAAGTTSEFDTLTAAKVEAALENITSTFNTTTNADLYGTQAAKSILIIENDEQDTTNLAATGLDEASNLGEYMIFEVSYANTTVAFNAANNFTVKLVGTVDMEDTASLAATDILS